jgi:hypothetical protein
MVALFLLATVLALLQWMDTGTKGSVRIGTPVSPLPPAQIVHVHTAYYTTVLPAGFSVKRQTGGTGLPQQFEANTPSQTDEQFAATIDAMPSDGFEGIASYAFRQKSPNLYEESAPTCLPAGAIAYRTISGPAELTLFWPHGKVYAAVSFSTDGVASFDQLQAVCSQTISEWVWQ